VQQQRKTGKEPSMRATGCWRCGSGPTTSCFERSMPGSTALRAGNPVTVPREPCHNLGPCDLQCALLYITVVLNTQLLQKSPRIILLRHLLFLMLAPTKTNRSEAGGSCVAFDASPFSLSPQIRTTGFTIVVVSLVHWWRLRVCVSAVSCLLPLACVSSERLSVEKMMISCFRSLTSILNRGGANST
jgi:hypothetical protein